MRAYLAYNAQDLDRLLALVAEDVDWPDDDGGRIHGRAALSAYWAEQWRRVHTHDHPIAFKHRDDGCLVVQVEQVVRTLDGATLSTSDVTHLLEVTGGLITRLDILGNPDAI